MSPEPAAPVVRMSRPVNGGWDLGMTLVRLDDGGLLVHSPTWLGDGTFERVLEVGEPRVLFAPNHHHHLSLARFHERWPAARVVASHVALGRLRRHGHAYAEVLDARVVLPAGGRVLECEGTKAGEAFVSLDGPRGRTWIVCDAFFHVTRPVTGAAGTFLRVTKATPGLAIGQTFLWLALKDRKKYRAWVLDAIERERPTTMWVSHGETLEGDDLPERLAELVRARV
jgi:hypothetical protein